MQIQKTNRKWFNYYGNITRSRNRFELYIKTNPQLYSPLFQETMQEDKVQKLEKNINDDYWKLHTQIMDLQYEIKDLN